jgi:hypothetical protein
MSVNSDKINSILFEKFRYINQNIIVERNVNLPNIFLYMILQSHRVSSLQIG